MMLLLLLLLSGSYGNNLKKFHHRSHSGLNGEIVSGWNIGLIILPLLLCIL